MGITVRSHLLSRESMHRFHLYRLASHNARRPARLAMEDRRISTLRASRHRLVFRIMCRCLRGLVVGRRLVLCHRLASLLSRHSKDPRDTPEGDEGKWMGSDYYFWEMCPSLGSSSIRFLSHQALGVLDCVKKIWAFTKGRQKGEYKPLLQAYGIAITNPTVQTDTMTCELAKDEGCGMRKKSPSDAFRIPRHIVTGNAKKECREAQPARCSD